MLYVVQRFVGNKFKPLTGEKIETNHVVEINGVKFRGLTLQQLAILMELKDHKNLFDDLQVMLSHLGHQRYKEN